MDSKLWTFLDTSRCCCWNNACTAVNSTSPRNIFNPTFLMALISVRHIRRKDFEGFLAKLKWAYVLIGGLDAKFGLYSSFLALAVFATMTTSTETIIGPSSICTALIQDYIRIPAEWPFNPAWRGGFSSPYLSQLLTWWVGLIVMLLGVFRLGWILNFVST